MLRPVETSAIGAYPSSSSLGCLMVDPCSWAPLRVTFGLVLLLLPHYGVRGSRPVTPQPATTRVAGRSKTTNPGQDLTATPYGPGNREHQRPAIAYNRSTDSNPRRAP